MSDSYTNPCFNEQNSEDMDDNNSFYSEQNETSNFNISNNKLARRINQVRYRNCSEVDSQQSPSTKEITIQNLSTKDIQPKKDPIVPPPNPLLPKRIVPDEPVKSGFQQKFM